MFKASFCLKAYLLIGMCLSFMISTAQICADSNGNILVTNTADEGPGSLREALDCANTTAGANLIKFNIPGAGPHVIFVGSATNQPLPALLDPGTILDARTQSGYLDHPLIVLDGGAASWNNPINAVWLRADFCEVYGLEIRNFPDDGIDLRTADESIIQYNYIHDNGSAQDYFPGVPGTGPWEGCGIVIRDGSDFNLISRNDIENNEYCGIILRNGGNNNLIGGQMGEDANNISENAVGIRVGNNSMSIHIQQNAIFCNDTLGIELVGNANNNQEAPVITVALSNQISGTANDGEVIEVFQSVNTYCPGAVCQGSIWLGTTVAVNGTWTITAPFQSGVVVGGGQAITATATDVLGNTSEFSACKVAIGTSGCTAQNGDIIVSNTNDSGAGSLRQAILCANATLGANTIRFEIPGDSLHTIYVGSTTDEALPALTDAGTTIDATTQSGFGDNGNFRPRIILDGSQTSWTAPINAVWVRGHFCEVYGLEIVNFPDDGIDVTLADYVKIGAIDKGNVIYKNGDETDFWPDAPGTGPWNGCGIVLRQGSDRCEVVGNYVGTNYEEIDTSGNELCGIIIQNGGDQNTIANNIIAHHSLGIRIDNGGIRNTLSQNSLYCNDSIPLNFIGNANLNHTPPEIDSASNVYLSGVADSLDVVEVFLNRDTACVGVPCQGSVYLGTVNVTDSSWVLEAPFDNGVVLKNGDFITATATDTLGNTSLFSACTAVMVDCDLGFSISNLMPTSCGANNGAFTANVFGGTAPYSLDIGQGTTNDTVFNNLAAGDYVLVVTDANNCTVAQAISIESSPELDASISIVVDASCGANNGSFTVEVSSGTPPFYYDIGNGNVTNNLFENLAAGTYMVTVTDSTACTMTLEAIISQSGSPEISVSNFENETCLLSNGSITVTASGGTLPYTYDIGNGPIGNPQITNLVAGDYAIIVTDGLGCTAVVIQTIVNEGSMPTAGFTYLVEDATVTFSNTSTVGESYNWDFDDGNFSTLENPVYTFENSGDYEVCLTTSNSCGSEIHCETIAIVVPLSEVNIGGVIAKENGQTVALTTVNCTDNPEQVTVLDGLYLFEDQEVGGSFVIEPVKDINYLNGCTAYDLFLINQHILGTAPLDSPYKIIAADIDRSGNVSTIDLVRLRQLILIDVDTFPNNTSWRFVPMNYVFMDPENPLDEDFPESITLTNVTDEQLDNDFVAIKIGDVNGSNNPASLVDPTDETDFEVQIFEEQNGLVNLDFYANDFQVISAFELSLAIDSDRLEFLNVVPISEQTPEVFYDKNGGTLNLAWYDRKGMGVKNDELFFRLSFRMKTSDWQNGLEVSNQLRPRMFDLSGKDSAIQLHFKNEKREASQAIPNPFINHTKIHFYLPESQAVKLRVFDLNGVLILEKERFFESGKNEAELDLKNHPSGMYFYEVGEERGVLIKR